MVGHVGRVFTLLIVFVVAFAGVRALVLSPGLLGDDYSQEMNIEEWANHPMTYSNGNEYEDSCGMCHDVVYSDLQNGDHGPDDVKGKPGVSCETCHGPALAHIDATGKEGKASTAPSVEGTRDFCAVCHKEIGNEIGPRTAVPTQNMDKHGGTADCGMCHDPHSAEAS